MTAVSPRHPQPPMAQANEMHGADRPAVPLPEYQSVRRMADIIILDDFFGGPSSSTSATARQKLWARLKSIEAVRRASMKVHFADLACGGDPRCCESRAEV